MGSYEWSLVGYGFIGLLMIFCCWLVLMMFLASKKASSRSRALPMLAPEVMKQESSESFFAASLEATPQQKRTSKSKRPTKSFFGAKPAGSSAVTPGDVGLSDARPVFQQDNFTLSDGSDRG